MLEEDEGDEEETFRDVREMGMRLLLLFFLQEMSFRFDFYLCPFFNRRKRGREGERVREREELI